MTSAPHKQVALAVTAVAPMAALMRQMAQAPLQTLVAVAAAVVHILDEVEMAGLESL